MPTAPPQSVQVEAVNSTTVHFLWNPPPQQFINGINQGYKVRGLILEPPGGIRGQCWSYCRMGSTLPVSSKVQGIK